MRLVIVGGNQRDTDRAKAAKKQAALNKSKAKESNTSLAKRKEAYVSLFHIVENDDELTPPLQ